MAFIRKHYGDMERPRGGYGIQDPYGMLFIERIEGDFYNVVGLPISRLYELLRNKFGI